MTEKQIVGRQELLRWGTEGTISLGAGVGLLLLRNLAQLGGTVSIVGIVVGSLVALGGLSIAARDAADRASGTVTVVAGSLTIAASLPLLAGIADPLLWIGGIGLVALGGLRLFRFFRGLRTRR